MEQRNPPAEDQSGAASPVPPWMRQTTPYAPDRRAKMLEHMARARSLPQPQAAPAPGRSSQGGPDLFSDLIGHIVLFGIVALIFMSRVPLYFGAFLLLTDGERIESVLAKLGIRFEPDRIGPDVIKGLAYWFGWFALLASLKGSAPTWLAPWMPQTESWSSIAGIALVLAIIEASAALAMRHASSWFGWQNWSNSLTWAAIKLALVIGLLAAVVLLGH